MRGATASRWDSERAIRRGLGFQGPYERSAREHVRRRVVDRLISPHDALDGIESGLVQAPLLVEKRRGDHDAESLHDGALADHRGGGDFFKVLRVEIRPLHLSRFGEGLVAPHPVVDLLDAVSFAEYRATAQRKRENGGRSTRVHAQEPGHSKPEGPYGNARSAVPRTAGRMSRSATAGRQTC